MGQYKFSRPFYVICALGLLAIVVVERITPHKAYAGFFVEKAQRAFEEPNLDKAKKYYLLAINADPLRAKSYYGLGDIFAGQGNYAQAIPYFQKATYVGTYKNQINFYSLGFAYYQLGFYERASVSFEKGVLIDPRYAQCRYYLILSLLKIGKKADIPVHFKKLKEYGTPEMVSSVESLLSGRQE